VLCAGIAVQDLVMRVPAMPVPGGKAMADHFITVVGGCALNAALAVARLGGRTHYAGPLGDASDDASNWLVAALRDESVGIEGVVRVAGAKCPVSIILIDAAGERMIATYRDDRVEAARVADPDRLVAGVDLMLADNRYPGFVRPLCEAARRRGLPVVLDADRPTTEDDPLFAIATHLVFSGECLRETTVQNDLAAGLMRIAARTPAFLAVSDGPGAVRYIAGGAVRELPVFKVEAVDTLAAGDVFHAGFALALAEGRDEVAALRFGAAAAALKCTRFGGSLGAPQRAEVEAFLAKQN
jgi:sugar/nucleoside kinase (ribokinase family)